MEQTCALLVVVQGFEFGKKKDFSIWIWKSRFWGIHTFRSWPLMLYLVTIWEKLESCEPELVQLQLMAWSASSHVPSLRVAASQLRQSAFQTWSSVSENPFTKTSWSFEECNKLAILVHLWALENGTSLPLIGSYLEGSRLCLCCIQ